MSVQDYTFESGYDPTPVWGGYAATLLQMIREATPNSYRGLVIYSDTTPDVTGDYVWQKRCAWINTTDWRLYVYDDDLGNWTDPGASLVNGSINSTAYFADQVVTVEKMAGNGSDSAGKVPLCDLDDLTVVWSSVINAITDGTLPLAKLPTLTAGTVLGSFSGGAPEELTFAEVVEDGLPDVAAGTIGVTKLAKGSKYDILAVNSADTVAWGSINTILPDNHILQKKIAVQTTTITFAAELVLDASVGDNFEVTLTANVTKFTILNMVPGQNIQLKVKQGGAGSYTFAFGGAGTAIKWPASTAPTLTGTLNHADIFSFVMFGTKVYGAYVQDFLDT